MAGKKWSNAQRTKFKATMTAKRVLNAHSSSDTMKNSSRITGEDKLNNWLNTVWGELTIEQKIKMFINVFERGF